MKRERGEMREGEEGGREGDYTVERGRGVKQSVPSRIIPSLFGV